MVRERSVDTRQLAAGCGSKDCAESGERSLLLRGCKYGIIRCSLSVFLARNI